MSTSLLSLNIMHGRNCKSAIFPPRVGLCEVQSNLQRVVACIREHEPDFVTLQEVDQSSALSGSFNQFDWLDERLKYPYKYFAPSCSVKFLDNSFFVSGNAIFSKYPLENCADYKFDFSFPTDRMGFVVADTKLPEGKIVTIASIHLVHLDWMRFNARAHQLKLVERVVAARGKSMVLAGDFNCDLIGEEASLRSFVRKLDLRAYESESKNFPTYPSWQPKKRIDWVLTSSDMNFTSYENLQNRMSDHLAIITNLSYTR